MTHMLIQVPCLISLAKSTTSAKDNPPQPDKPIFNSICNNSQTYLTSSIYMVSTQV